MRRATTRYCESRKDPLLAASRTAPDSPAVSTTGRISFAKIAEPMEVPDLLDLQIDSFDWLVGNEAWRHRVEPPSSRGSDRRQHQVRPGGDLRGDLSDRGLLRNDVALVPRPPLRAAEELRRRVQGPRRHLRGPAVRHRRVHEQRDRRDQEPDGLHGRLPADDRQGHVRHQRHRAGRRLPARPLARCLLRADHRQDLRQGHLHLQDDPVARCVAGVRDRQARHGRRAARPQAQAERHRAAEGPRLDRRPDPGGVRRVRVDAAHPGEGPHVHPGRGAARHLPQAASGRTADPRGRAGAAGELLLQPEALRPGQGRSLQDQQEARPGRALRQAGR